MEISGRKSLWHAAIRSNYELHENVGGQVGHLVR